MTFTAATAQLRRRLGTRVATTDSALFRASFDGSKLSFLPEAVISPKTDDDIATTLTLANKHRVPVTSPVRALPCAVAG
jgi:glycolate oxidase